MWNKSLYSPQDHDYSRLDKTLVWSWPYASVGHNHIDELIQLLSGKYEEIHKFALYISLHKHTHTGNELWPIRAFARNNVILTSDVIYIRLNATTMFIFLMSGRIHHRLCPWSAGWVTGHGTMPRVVACGSASLNCDGVVTYQWYWTTDRICQLAGCKKNTQ